MHLDRVPTVIAGRVPDGWPSPLVPPPPASTLGGMTVDMPFGTPSGMTVGTALTAVFRYPPSVTQPVSEYRGLLERDGWAPPEGRMQQGFDSTHLAMYVRGAHMVIVQR